jgi:glucose/arabinose dehydrogenase
VLRRTLALFLVWLALLPWMADAAAAEPREAVATDLSFPSNMAFAPDGRLFFAEKDTGDIRVIEDGRLLPEPFAHIDVLSSTEQGLLGLALDPAFDVDPWIYVYYSDPASRTNRLIRLRGSGDATERQPLLDALTTEHGYHNGGDIVFGTDGTLFVAVGEVHEPERAQDPGDIGGKILRLNADGSIPADNPMGPENPAYSMGHRNSFGLCVDPDTGDLWETENGPGSDDEVNLIQAGGNYGWPDQLGPGGTPTFVDPVLDFPEVIVPTGCAVWRGDLYFGAYGTDLLYRLALPASSGASAAVMDDLGEGVTDLAVGPDGDLYVATTDTIWRYAATGTPGPSSSLTPGTSTPVTRSPSPANAPPEDDGDGSNTAIAVVAGIVLAAGLALRLRAGRKLRRDTSAPGGDGG